MLLWLLLPPIIWLFIIVAAITGLVAVAVAVMAEGHFVTYCGRNNDHRKIKKYHDY